MICSIDKPDGSGPRVGSVRGAAGDATTAGRAAQPGAFGRVTRRAQARPRRLSAVVQIQELHRASILALARH